MLMVHQFLLGLVILIYGFVFFFLLLFGGGGSPIPIGLSDPSL